MIHNPNPSVREMVSVKMEPRRKRLSQILPGSYMSPPNDSVEGAEYAFWLENDVWCFLRCVESPHWYVSPL